MQFNPHACKKLRGDVKRWDFKPPLVPFPNLEFCYSDALLCFMNICNVGSYCCWPKIFIWQDLSNMDTTSAFFDLFLHTGARVVKCVNIYYSRTNAFTYYCNSGAFLWFLLLQIFNIWATFMYCWRWIICIEYDKCILYQNIYLIPSFNRGASCENSKHNQPGYKFDCRQSCSFAMAR